MLILDEASTIRAAEIIYAIDAGVVSEPGTHDELLVRGGIYARLYREQFGDGLVEARCRDGLRLSDGRTLAVGQPQSDPDPVPA